MKEFAWGKIKYVVLYLVADSCAARAACSQFLRDMDEATRVSLLLLLLLLLVLVLVLLRLLLLLLLLTVH